MFKEFILQKLLTASTPLSGQDLANELGVSRSSIWKQIQNLSALGYQIEGTPSQGYRLKEGPQSLCELEIRARLPQVPLVRVLSSVPSTNDWLKAHWLSLPHGTVLLAKEQTLGRGRYGRTFYSPENGGLYLSVLLKEAPLPAPFALTLAAGVAVCRTLESYGLHPTLKWVNDLFLNEKKLGGILTEADVEWQSRTYSHLILGIGLNITTSEFPKELDGLATSLYLETQHHFPLNALAATLLEELLRALNDLPRFPVICPEEPLPSTLLHAYRSRLHGVGAPVSYSPYESAQPLIGTLLGITDQGALKIDSTHGIQTFQSGEIRWRPLSPTPKKDF